MICPECSTQMARAGGQWNGRKLVQQYKCPKCGRRHMDKNEPYVPPKDRKAEGKGEG